MVKEYPSLRRDIWIFIVELAKSKHRALKRFKWRNIYILVRIEKEHVHKYKESCPSKDR